MSMFCFQCQRGDSGRKGCTVRGVCSKSEEVAKLQDLLIHTLRLIGKDVTEHKIDVSGEVELNQEMLPELFTTITNVNFDRAKAIEAEIKKLLFMREELLREHRQGGTGFLGGQPGSHAEKSGGSRACWRRKTRTFAL